MGLLYDRNNFDGQGQVGMHNIPLDGSPMHVTEFNPLTNERISWNTDGEGDHAIWDRHYTNQNIPKGQPGRH